MREAVAYAVVGAHADVGSASLTHAAGQDDQGSAYVFDNQ